MTFYLAHSINILFLLYKYGKVAVFYSMVNWIKSETTDLLWDNNASIVVALIPAYLKPNSIVSQQNVPKSQQLAIHFSWSWKAR